MEEGRRFKIQEIKKYETKTDEERNRIVLSCCLILSTLLLHSSSEIGYPADLAYIFGYVIHIFNLFDGLKLSKKYEKKIEELKEEFGPLYEQYLEEYNHDMSKGRSR